MVLGQVHLGAEKIREPLLNAASASLAGPLDCGRPDWRLRVLEILDERLEGGEDGCKERTSDAGEDIECKEQARTWPSKVSLKLHVPEQERVTPMAVADEVVEALFRVPMRQ